MHQPPKLYRQHAFSNETLLLDNNFLLLNNDSESYNIYDELQLEDYTYRTFTPIQIEENIQINKSNSFNNSNNKNKLIIKKNHSF